MSGGEKDKAFQAEQKKAVVRHPSQYHHAKRVSPSFPTAAAPVTHLPLTLETAMDLRAAGKLSLSDVADIAVLSAEKEAEQKVATPPIKGARAERLARLQAKGVREEAVLDWGVHGFHAYVKAMQNYVKTCRVRAQRTELARSLPIIDEAKLVGPQKVTVLQAYIDLQLSLAFGGAVLPTHAFHYLYKALQLPIIRTHIMHRGLDLVWMIANPPPLPKQIVAPKRQGLRALVSMGNGVESKQKQRVGSSLNPRYVWEAFVETGLLDIFVASHKSFSLPQIFDRPRIAKWCIHQYKLALENPHLKEDTLKTISPLSNILRYVTENKHVRETLLQQGSAMALKQILAEAKDSGLNSVVAAYFDAVLPAMLEKDLEGVCFSEELHHLQVLIEYTFEGRDLNEKQTQLLTRFFQEKRHWFYQSLKEESLTKLPSVSIEKNPHKEQAKTWFHRGMRLERLVRSAQYRPVQVEQGKLPPVDPHSNALANQFIRYHAALCETGFIIPKDKRFFGIYDQPGIKGLLRKPGFTAFADAYREANQRGLIAVLAVLTASDFSVDNLMMLVQARIINSDPNTFVQRSIKLITALPDTPAKAQLLTNMIGHNSLTKEGRARPKRLNSTPATWLYKSNGVVIDTERLAFVERALMDMETRALTKIRRSEQSKIESRSDAFLRETAVHTPTPILEEKHTRNIASIARRILNADEIVAVTAWLPEQKEEADPYNIISAKQAFAKQLLPWVYSGDQLESWLTNKIQEYERALPVFEKILFQLGNGLPEIALDIIDREEFNLPIITSELYPEFCHYVRRLYTKEKSAKPATLMSSIITRNKKKYPSMNEQDIREKLLLPKLICWLKFEDDALSKYLLKQGELVAAEEKRVAQAEHNVSSDVEHLEKKKKELLARIAADKAPFQGLLTHIVLYERASLTLKKAVFKIEPGENFKVYVLKIMGGECDMPPPVFTALIQHLAEQKQAGAMTAEQLQQSGIASNRSRLALCSFLLPCLPGGSALAIPLIKYRNDLTPNHTGRGHAVSPGALGLSRSLLPPVIPPDKPGDTTVPSAHRYLQPKAKFLIWGINEASTAQSRRTLPARSRSLRPGLGLTN